MTLYRLQREFFGLRLTLGGEITVADIVKLKKELATLLTTLNQPFGSIADIRTVIPPKTDVKEMLGECEQMTRVAGLQRRAIVFQSPVVGNQARQLSFKSNTDSLERQINANLTDDWEKLALDWVVGGIEPLLSQNVEGNVRQPG